MSTANRLTFAAALALALSGAAAMAAELPGLGKPV